MGMMKDYFSCDGCGEANYTPDNPFIEARVPRPSNPKELCCVLAGHQRCLRTRPLKVGSTGGAGTPEMWEAWAQSKEAQSGGFCLG